jgi:hypothetical protein
MTRGLIEASPVPNRFCSLPVGNLASAPIASPLPELRTTLYLPRIKKSPGPDADADAIAWTSWLPRYVSTRRPSIEIATNGRAAPMSNRSVTPIFPRSVIVLVCKSSVTDSTSNG